MDTPMDRAAMDVLLAKAERDGLWLCSQYASVWFSPAELRDHQARGSFRWGPVNWTLRDPEERIAQLTEAVAKAETALVEFRMRVLAAQGHV